MMEPHPPAPTPFARRFPGARVLLIEDHPVSRQVAIALLRRFGTEVTAAASGEEGVALALDGSHALVLMDLRLPDMSGFEATRRIRAAASGRALRIVALSADAGPADREASRGAGIDDHLAKPLDPALLEAALARWLPPAAAEPAPAGPDPAEATDTEPDPSPATAPTTGPAAFGFARALGLDVKRGLRFFGGDAATYRTALARYAAMYRHGLPGAPASASTEVQQQALHALTGASAVIGATAIAAEADRLERVVPAFDAARRARELRRFGDTVSTLAARLMLELH